MNTFGNSFRLTVFGESHGVAIGVVIDGCPSGIALSENDFMPDLQRRKSGAFGTTSRKEDDIPRIVSGVYKGFTTGAPITILFENNDVQSENYEQFRDIPRPGHADFVLSKKWNNFNDIRGGGYSSGRLTLTLVAAGVIAKKIISPVEINAVLVEAGGEICISETVEKVVAAGDSIGGIISCTAKKLPIGLGSPFFNSVESLISHLVFSISGVNGIEFGAGFGAAKMRGSEHNDCFISTDGKTATNNAGGINGGITNGNELIFRVSVKPTSSIACAQQTINMQTNEMCELAIAGRHDACFALRLPVIIEAVTAIALADLK